jgi:hypothetical protein
MKIKIKRRRKKTRPSVVVPLIRATLLVTPWERATKKERKERKVASIRCRCLGTSDGDSWG